MWHGLCVRVGVPGLAAESYWVLAGFHKDAVLWSEVIGHEMSLIEPEAS